ncbi:hypothetical protein ROHU_005050 [Labeo rohita]|uniref:Uncharacterized protein n=1 Tax=Labeo rohita TaxID=84645 RepID=A0A498N7Y0_LABRO|nr:hypothetical protein ROHU_022225 [Labeo rohita]RXN30278.1 hypothetical protein ROHU_005050 [Labeo rohita]
MTCFKILKIMQLQLYLLICCRAAETLTDRLTGLHATTDSPPKYSNSTRLHITGPTPNLESKSYTLVSYTEQNRSHCLIIILISAFITALLITVIADLLMWSQATEFNKHSSNFKS